MHSSNVLHNIIALPTLNCHFAQNTENEDYNSAISPATATLNRNNRRMCHSVLINDDEDSEPRETFSVNIMPTGPSQEFINLFDITVPDTNVSIVDDDSEL